MDKSVVFILFILLFLSGMVPLGSAHNAPFPGSHDPTVAVVDSINEPETTDPAWSSDIFSAEVIFNVYETMLFYDNVMIDGPYAAGKVDQFKPLLATEWSWRPGPTPYAKTVYFKIRTGVTFHDGSLLTPVDVEYSWERAMVQDRDGGPMGMFAYPVFDLYAAADPLTDPNFGDKINNAIESNSTHAWVHLMNNFPETRFLQIMSLPWASVVEKAWAVAKGDFDGNWAAEWQLIYDTWHNPDVSFIEDAMMGTGPYMFDFWDHGNAWSIIKYDAYWDGWPARVERQPAATNERIGGFITRIVWYLKTGWADRRARFLAGDSDFTFVPGRFRDQVLGQIVGGEEIRCFYPVEPQLAASLMCFNFNITQQSYNGWGSGTLGPRFDPANPYIIAEDRTPMNLFSDVHMRRGFAAAFDYDTFIQYAYLDEAERPSDVIVNGLSYDNPAQAKPMFNMTKAEEELKLAWVGHPDDDLATPEGAIWDRGMTFTIWGSSFDWFASETAIYMIMDSINSLNSKFHISTPSVEYPYWRLDLTAIVNLNRLADYPDADNCAFPFMHSQGTFANMYSYSNPRVDQLIEAGALMPDDTNPYNGELDYPDPRPYFNNPGGIPPDTRWPRRSIYYELQAIYVEDAPGFGLAQPEGRVWQQAWMRGWYYNPVYRGNYFYHIWKAQTHFGDANNDGVVDVSDAATVSASWYPGPPTGPLGYKTQADLTGGTGGVPGGGSGPVAGIPDGKVNVLDAAFVSAHWDGPPQGPSHP